MEKKAQKGVRRIDRANREVDVREWGLSAKLDKVPDLQDYVMDRVNDVLKTALDKYKVEVWFWPDEDSKRPLTINIVIPLGHFEGEGPEWTIDLASVLTQSMRDRVGSYGGKSMHPEEYQMMVSWLDGCAEAFERLAREARKCRNQCGSRGESE